MKIEPGKILNESEVIQAIRSKRGLSPAELFDRYADAKRAGRERAFLRGLSASQFDALVASLKGASK